jgi:DNA-directed RNA polymerase specialized sigma subunit
VIVDDTERPPLTDAERELLALALPEAHRLAMRMARQCPNLSPGELKALAEDGLLDKLRTFDGSRGVALFRYSREAIEGLIVRAAQRRSMYARGRTVRPTKGGVRAMLAIAVFGETLEEVPISELVMATTEDVEAKLTELGEESGDAARFGIALADDEAATPESERARRELREDLIAAISQEGSEVAALVVALVIEEATWEAAAEARQMSVSTAQRKVKKAFERIRARLETRGHR